MLDPGQQQQQQQQQYLYGALINLTYSSAPYTENGIKTYSGSHNTNTFIDES